MAEEQPMQEESGVVSGQMVAFEAPDTASISGSISGGAAGAADTTSTLVAGDNWRPPAIENIPQAPVRFATVSGERLAMLATARCNRLGDSAWAAISGLCASLPATIHDLIEAYWIENPIGLSATRLIDIIVTIFFFAFTVFALTRDRGRSAQQILQEILNPAINAKRSWSEIWSKIWSQPT
jgi:hypothetical protein